MISCEFEDCRTHSAILTYRREFYSTGPWTPPNWLPATKLNGESDGEFGELENMRETEFV